MAITILAVGSDECIRLERLRSNLCLWLGLGLLGEKTLQPFRPLPLTIITETLFRPSFFLEVLKQRPQRRHNLGQRDQILEQEVEPMAQDMAADVNRVFITAAANQTDVALVRPSAAVRATGHPHAELLVLQPQPLQL